MHLLQIDIDHLIELGVFSTDSQGRILSDLDSVGDKLSNYSPEVQADIDKTLHQLNHEIMLAVFELDEAMFVAMVSFSFPFQLAMAYIYSKYTNRNFVLRSTSIVDMAIFGCVVLWFEKYEEYIHDGNSGFGLSDPPHEFHIFM